MEKEWIAFRMSFDGWNEGAASEAAGAAAEASGALGASEAAPASRGIPEWDLYFPAGADRARVESVARQFLEKGANEADGSQVEFHWIAVETRDWAAGWREYFQPLDVEPWFRVVPPWRAGENLEAPKQAIIIDPGQGFGTGHHESTRLSLRSVGELTLAGARVLDVGSGSGILSIAAALKGARLAVGVEIDAPSIENARRNIGLNFVDDIVRLVNGGPEAVWAGRFDCVFCNMLLRESAPLLPLLMRLCAPGGVVALSGILANEESEALTLFDQRLGWIEERTSLGEWSRIVWRRN